MKRLYHRLFYALILLICFASVLLQLHSGFVILAAAYDNAPSASETQDIPDPLEVYYQNGGEKLDSYGKLVLRYKPFLYDFVLEYYGKSALDGFDFILSDEFCKAYNNDFPHPYLAGEFTENGEAIIRGLKITGYVDGEWTRMGVQDIEIPDEIEGHPVTEILPYAFAETEPIYYWPEKRTLSVTIGDNVRLIGAAAFEGNRMRSVKLGKNVKTIVYKTFSECVFLSEISDWGNQLKTIQSYAFYSAGMYADHGMRLPPFPETLEAIDINAFLSAKFSEPVMLPKSLRTLGDMAFAGCVIWNNSTGDLVFLNSTLPITVNPLGLGESGTLVGYSGSTAEAAAEQYGYAFCAIDGESLLFDGAPVEGNVLHLDHNMTEAELLPRLASDGAECEVRLGGLRDGKVVNGSTVTLWNTEVDAEGKVYTVEKTPEIESVAVETMPNKTAYFEGESFDPAGLTLRVTYDDGTSEVVSDGFTCTGMPTVTVTYNGCTTQFDVTVTPVCVESVAIAASPKKTNYAYKEAFDPEGLTLTVTYNNGKTETVTEGFTLHGADNLKVGKNTITAEYETKTATFDVTVQYTWWQHLIRIFLLGFLWY